MEDACRYMKVKVTPRCCSNGTETFSHQTCFSLPWHSQDGLERFPSPASFSPPQVGGDVTHRLPLPQLRGCCPTSGDGTENRSSSFRHQQLFAVLQSLGKFHPVHQQGCKLPTQGNRSAVSICRKPRAGCLNTSSAFTHPNRFLSAVTHPYGVPKLL